MERTSRNSVSSDNSSSVSLSSAPPAAAEVVSLPAEHNSSFPCLESVVELQSKFFPVQPRGGNITERDIRNAGILPMSAEGVTSASPPHLPPQGKLKEPRDLYSTATLLHPLKWPVECQVIPEKIRHVDYVPPKLEPFYTPTGKEPQPQPVGVEMGTVVYDYQPRLSVDYFCRATVGGSQDLEEFGPPPADPTGESSTLKFESRFESGNLAKAIKVTNMYYELYLRPDLYTERHAQWFYFRIQNTRDNIQYRFSIVNFNKPDSLYRYGLKVLMYSEKEAQLNGVGWTRAGQNLAYFKNDISPDENGPYYTLTFNLKFRHNNDTVYLAQCYPYTYSTLQTYLKSIEEDEFKSQLLTIRLLCRSLAGNNVHVLTVTSPPSSSSSPSACTSPADSGNVSQHSSTETEPSEASATNKKPVIVISARVHPGETQSSYMMKGIIDFLTSNCAQAKELRDRFIFKLIPMLNPDGVIVGNSRCCLLGQDLNRQYRTVLREAFPQIYHAKVMLRRLQEENGIFLYCDLHGHSRRHNVFIYGCENRRVPEKRLLEQVFPLMMHKNAADKFSFQNCKFKIQKNKEGTGRIFVWTLGVLNSYTLEISLGGSTMPSRQYTHFNTGDFEACGRHFCETLLDFSDPSVVKESLRERILQKLMDEGSTADEPKNVQLSDYSSLSNSETDGEADEDSDVGDAAKDSNSSAGDKKGVLQVSNSNSSNNGTQSLPGSKFNLKRQVSLRKHHASPHQQRNGKLATLGKKILVGDNRSPLPVHRASVDFTKVISKQRKLDEPIVLAPPPSSPALELEESSCEMTIKTEDYVSASYRRLTKFRKKSKRHPGVNLEQLSHIPSHQTAKCTTILFDDPFKPPGKPTKQHKKQSHKYTLNFYGKKDNSNYTETTYDHQHTNGDHMDWLSGTEDECDPYDRPAPTIKITDCCARSDDELDNEDNGLRGLLGEMGKLKLSSSDTEEIPVFAPFAPTLPVGKAFLHQTFYPAEREKHGSGSPKRLGSGGTASKFMINSLSDTTISTKVVSGGTPSSSRRSSISYLVSSATAGAIFTRGGKLQATGNTIFASSSGQSMSNGDNNRRRVSWTGTLTVSVPNVLPGTPGFPRSPSLQQQRKKSFRKSRSLNETGSRSEDISPNECSSAPISSMVSMDRIPGAMMLGVAKASSSSGGMGSQVGNVGNATRTAKWNSSSNSSRSHAISTSHATATSVVGPTVSGKVKKRGKLKRSKHHK